MSFDEVFSTLDISGSALHAERTRMNVVANNIANANVTSKSGRPPSRQAVIFKTALAEAGAEQSTRGVSVSDIRSVKSAPRMVHDPGHPHANDEGYVAYPNINAFQEMANLISASRSYGANLAVSRTFKEMMLKTIQMGR